MHTSAPALSARICTLGLRLQALQCHYAASGGPESGLRTFEPPLKTQEVLEGLVDDPMLANPKLRQERLGTGWFGVIVEYEGVLVESAHEDHMRAWQEVCRNHGKASPPFFVLNRIEGMKDEQVRLRPPL